MFAAFKMQLMGGVTQGFEITTSLSATAPNGTSRVCFYPAGSQPGDLIILIAGHNATGSVTFPAGWANMVSQPTPLPCTRLAWQLYPETSPASVTVTTASTVAGLGAIMLRIPRAAFDALGDFQTSNPPVPVGPTAAGGLALAVFRSSNGASTWTTPSGMDLVVARTGFNCSIFSEVVPAGAVGSRTATPSIGTPKGMIFTIKAAV